MNLTLVCYEFIHFTLIGFVVALCNMIIFFLDGINKIRPFLVNNDSPNYKMQIEMKKTMFTFESLSQKIMKARKLEVHQSNFGLWRHPLISLKVHTFSSVFKYQLPPQQRLRKHLHIK